MLLWEERGLPRMTSWSYPHFSVCFCSFSPLMSYEEDFWFLLPFLSFPSSPEFQVLAMFWKSSLLYTLELRTCFFLPSVTQHLDIYSSWRRLLSHPCNAKEFDILPCFQSRWGMYLIWSCVPLSWQGLSGMLPPELWGTCEHILSNSLFSKVSLVFCPVIVWVN